MVVDLRIGTSDYDGKRLPAWTDRILYKANVANYDNYKLSLRQHSYNAHQHFLQSDHKVQNFVLYLNPSSPLQPVTSQFSGSMFSAATATSLLLPKFHPIVEFVDTGWSLILCFGINN